MVKVRVPATSANIGVGFDCLGVALSLYTTFTFEKSDELIITGCDEKYANKDNLIYTSFLKTLDYLNIEPFNIKIDIDCNIPVSRGLGSSASCIVGGIMGAFALSNTTVDKSIVLDLATMIEGHPDNVAPCVYGNLCASCIEDGKVFNEIIEVASNFSFLALIPNYETETKEMRKVLPEKIDFKDAIYNSSRLAVLIRAIEKGELDVINKVLKDRLHEPYRKNLIHEYEEVKNICLDIDSVAFFISGSGSTLMNLIKSKESALIIEEKVKNLSYEWKTFLLNVDTQGAIIC